jgi:SAM-dependent methyltransferase
MSGGNRTCRSGPPITIPRVTHVNLGMTFDGDAELYDRVRPGYPAVLFDELAALTAVGPGCRLLELGAGTGKATVPLAERGCRIVAVEPGANMAAVARRDLAGFDAELVVSTFEAWPLPAEPFDVVFAATAFHWLDPALRAQKAADALRPGGALAVVETHHIAGGDVAFFAASQRCYERSSPESATPPADALVPAADIPADASDVDGSGRFEPTVWRDYEWERTYSTAGYLDVLMTYSGHRALPDDRRRALLGCIADLIENRHGGSVTKRYLTRLRVAHRLTVVG